MREKNEILFSVKRKPQRRDSRVAVCSLSADIEREEEAFFFVSNVKSSTGGRRLQDTQVFLAIGAVFSAQPY